MKCIHRIEIVVTEISLTNQGEECLGSEEIFRAQIGGDLEAEGIPHTYKDAIAEDILGLTLAEIEEDWEGGLKEILSGLAG